MREHIYIAWKCVQIIHNFNSHIELFFMHTSWMREVTVLRLVSKWLGDSQEPHTVSFEGQLPMSIKSRSNWLVGAAFGICLTIHCAWFLTAHHVNKLHEAPLVISGQWQWLILCRLMRSRDAIESSLTFVSIGIHASESGAHFKGVNYDYTASVLSSTLLPETCSLLFSLWSSPTRWSDIPRMSQQVRRSQKLRTQIFAVLMGGTGDRFLRACVLLPIQELHPSSPLQSQARAKYGVHTSVYLLYWTNH